MFFQFYCFTFTLLKANILLLRALPVLLAQGEWFNIATVNIYLFLILILILIYFVFFFFVFFVFFCFFLIYSLLLSFGFSCSGGCASPVTCNPGSYTQSTGQVLVWKLLKKRFVHLTFFFFFPVKDFMRKKTNYTNLWIRRMHNFLERLFRLSC